VTGPVADGVTRRRLFGLAGGAAAIGAVGFAGGVGAARATSPEPGAPSKAARYPFHGEHQAGIVTPAQDRLHFAAFDVTATTRAELVALLRAWTEAAADMTRGRPVGDGVPTPYAAPPADTGEASGLPASRLTITFGFGPSLFRDGEGRDRFGVADRQPRALRRLPHFPADALDPARSDGDLCVQACADDPQVAVHAVRNLSRIAFGRAAIRWSQMGFGRTSKTTSAQQTPRNLMGFKDGTNNILAEDATAIDQHVWVPADGTPAWLAGGSYLVARKIEMLIESWDRVRLTEQEAIIGRAKGSGAPLSGGEEHSELDFEAAVDGVPAIDPVAHVRLAHQSTNNGIRILRRGYNYVDGNNPYGRLDAGLFFISYQRSPEQFITLQRSLASDVLNEYIRHVGSAIYAVPPGTDDGGFIGETLLG
jgi:deferrochelatase/peroxidase EfeB